jgi:hypothetical protein
MDLRMDNRRQPIPMTNIGAMISFVTPNYAMQRSSRVGTPLAGTASGSHRFHSASSAPTARRR